jgi:hypothetical protein
MTIPCELNSHHDRKGVAMVFNLVAWFATMNNPTNNILQLCASKDEANMWTGGKNLVVGDKEETISTSHLLQHTLV